MESSTPLDAGTARDVGISANRCDAIDEHGPFVPSTDSFYGQYDKVTLANFKHYQFIDIEPLISHHGED